MKHELTAKRLSLAISNIQITQQELADKSGVSKASISQYINGSHVPSNISSGKMAKILCVNPLWLMGFDVPMEQYTLNELNKMSAKDLRRDEISHSDFMDKLLMLDYTDFAKIEERIDMLLESDKYKKDATFTSAKAI